MDGRIAKRTEIWNSGALTTHIWGAFDVVVFKVIWGSFGTFVSKWLVNRKRLVIERNGVKFRTQEHSYNTYGVTHGCLKGEYRIYITKGILASTVKVRISHLS